MGSTTPSFTSRPVTEKLSSAVEQWLRYFDDLGLRSFYLDRAGRALPDEVAAGTQEETGQEIASLPKKKSLEAAVVSEKSQVRPTSLNRPTAAQASVLGLKSESPQIALSESAHPPLLFKGLGDAPETLEVIASDLGECTRCKLHTTRNKIVFGVGNPHAELVFVGEGPGHDEDMQGIPFVGRAGKLLTQMIEAMGLSRGDVYIANVVKCRPPENRQPQPDEVETCMPFLLRQLSAIGPKVIVCLGSTAAQSLLETRRGISQFRGQWLDFHGMKLMATYHPAYLLRNPNAKPEVWTDLQKVMAELGLKMPSRNTASRPRA